MNGDISKLVKQNMQEMILDKNISRLLNSRKIIRGLSYRRLQGDFLGQEHIQLEKLYN